MISGDAEKFGKIPVHDFKRKVFVKRPAGIMAQFPVQIGFQNQPGKAVVDFRIFKGVALDSCVVFSQKPGR